MLNDRRSPGKSVEDAQQAEDSPNTFVILTISLAALAVIGAVLLWYFGMFGHLTSLWSRS